MGIFKKLFGQEKSVANDPDRSEDLEQVENLLEAVAGDDARYLAAFALLLARVADADSVITEGERDRIRALLAKHANMSPSYAELVSTLAVKRTLANVVEEHILYRELNKIASKGQKVMMLRALFFVAADDDVSERESKVIENVAKGLQLSSEEFTTLRAEFRDHLAVLKKKSG